MAKKKKNQEVNKVKKAKVTTRKKCEKQRGQWKEYQARYRSNLTPQKKRRINERRRAAYAAKKGEKAKGPDNLNPGDDKTLDVQAKEADNLNLGDDKTLDAMAKEHNQNVVGQLKNKKTCRKALFSAKNFKKALDTLPNEPDELNLGDDKPMDALAKEHNQNVVTQFKTKKAYRKALFGAKKGFPRDTEKFAICLNGVVNTATPRKRRLLKSLGVSYSVPPKRLHQHIS